MTDTEALAHLEDACARQDDAEGPYCLQEGGAWCDDHCPFHDWPPDEGPLAWG
ncbi:MAG TPA: hypothetical protein VF077_12415 [Nitrospiraceae bacterium]